MAGPPLVEEAYALLNDTSLSQEDSVDAVERLVNERRDDLTPQAAERLILDILMAHHRGKSADEVVVAAVARVESAKPVKLPVIPGSQSLQPLSTFVERQAEPKRPFDELRDLLGTENTDGDIERALAHNDYDFVRMLEMLSGQQKLLELTKEQMAERVMCRYYLAGNCIRGSQCMYSHDASRRLCRFWLHERCMAGDACPFRHDVPYELVPMTPVAAPKQTLPLNSLPSLGSLPALGSKRGRSKVSPGTSVAGSLSAWTAPPTPAASSLGGLAERSAPTTGQTNSFLPSQKPAQAIPKFVPIKDVLPSHQGRVPLVSPRLTPWKTPEFGSNQKYVDLRLEALKFAELRNRTLQQSTAKWSENDAYSAKKLSAEGQALHTSMINAYREAAELLWEQRKCPASEIWLDLHGLELLEAVDELEERLEEIEATEKHSPRVVYVITGRGHFKAKKYADQLSQYTSALLDSRGYKHRGLGVHPTFGRTTAIDPWSALHPRHGPSKSLGNDPRDL